MSHDDGRKYHPEWENDFSWLRKVTIGMHFANCDETHCILKSLFLQSMQKGRNALEGKLLKAQPSQCSQWKYQQFPKKLNGLKYVWQYVWHAILLFLLSIMLEKFGGGGGRGGEQAAVNVT